MIQTKRHPFLEYFEIKELPIGELPFSAIEKALKDEKFLRKFTPSFARENLLQGHDAALLYWYPHYIDKLYDLAAAGESHTVYFRAFPDHMLEGFSYLFPEIISKLNKVIKASRKLNHLEENKLRGII